MFSVFRPQENNIDDDIDGPFLICLELALNVIKKLRCPCNLTVDTVASMLTENELVTLLLGNAKIGRRTKGTCCGGFNFLVRLYIVCFFHIESVDVMAARLIVALLMHGSIALIAPGKVMCNLDHIGMKVDSESGTDSDGEEEEEHASKRLKSSSIGTKAGKRLGANAYK